MHYGAERRGVIEETRAGRYFGDKYQISRRCCLRIRYVVYSKLASADIGGFEYAQTISRASALPRARSRLGGRGLLIIFDLLRRYSKKYRKSKKLRRPWEQSRVLLIYMERFWTRRPDDSVNRARAA